MIRFARFLCVLLAAATAVVANSSSALAQATGAESFSGQLVASGASGNREVLASVVRARGVFDGVGRIVERDNLPGDPENVSRDDLVFAAGTVHIVNTNLDFSVDVNPASCIVRVTVRQVTTTDGGTGLFANASGTFDGSVAGMGLAPRNPDGSCSMEQALRFEIDNVAGTGTLSL
jgi:hypothetical protein